MCTAFGAVGAACCSYAATVLMPARRKGMHLRITGQRRGPLDPTVTRGGIRLPCLMSARDNHGILRSELRDHGAPTRSFMGMHSCAHSGHRCSRGRRSIDREKESSIKTVKKAVSMILWEWFSLKEKAPIPYELRDRSQLCPRWDSNPRISLFSRFSLCYFIGFTRNLSVAVGLCCEFC